MHKEAEEISGSVMCNMVKNLYPQLEEERGAVIAAIYNRESQCEIVSLCIDYCYS